MRDLLKTERSLPNRGHAIEKHNAHGQILHARSIDKTKKTNSQLAAQQHDTVDGIDIRPLSGRDFQPVGESNYGWAQARIINPDDYQAGDQIDFDLSGCNAHVYDAKDQRFKSVVVDSEGHTSDLKFQVPDGTKAGKVTVRATLQRDPRVSGTRDFTFIEVPIATPKKLGCVMVGDGLTVSDTGLLTPRAQAVRHTRFRSPALIPWAG